MKTGALLMMLLLLVLAPFVSGQALTDADADYIAKVTSNIEKYITWPEGNYEGRGKLLVISVVGSSAVSEKLAALDGQETVDGKTFKVREVEPNDLPANSHMLVVADSNTAVIDKALRLLKDRGTLIVGVKEGFAALGCMMNYAKSAGDGQKVGIEVNATSMKDANFQVNPALLKMAKVIE